MEDDKPPPPQQQEQQVELAGDKRKREEDSLEKANGDAAGASASAAAASAGEEAGSGGGGGSHHPMSKTSLCSFFRRRGTGPDGCNHGESCRYAHSEEELRPRRDGSWDPTSDRAKKLRKVAADAEEIEEEVVTIDEKSLDKCLVGLSRGWTVDRLKTFLQEQGISYATAKKKKGMTVGFVTFETIEQLENAVEILKENRSGGREIKIADANRRAHQKLHTEEPVSDNGVAAENGSDAATLAEGTSVPEAAVPSKRTVRDAVTPLAHMTYIDQLEHKKNSVAQLLKKLTRNAKKACPADIPNPDWVFKSKEIVPEPPSPPSAKIQPRNMGKKQEPSTPSAGGTPWKGRLRSHHAAPLGSPSPRTPSPLRSRDEEAKTSKKQTALKNPARRRSTQDADDGAVRCPTRVQIPPRRSLRLAFRDPERQVVIDGAGEECKVAVSKSATTTIRRSTRFHLDDKSSRKPIVEKESYQREPLSTPNPRNIPHNWKTKISVSKDRKRQNPTSSRKRNAAVKTSARMKNHKEPQSLCQNSKDVHPRRKDADVSCKKNEMQELNPSYCEELTKKRKRGTEGKPTSKKQIYQEPKSVCQEIAPIIEPTNSIHRKREMDDSLMMQPKIGDNRLMNTKANNEEINGIEKGVQQQLCGIDDWTEEQDITLRQAYFAARPSPHFWKKVSKMVPGKSAEECFNRVHADLSTPTPIAPRPRTSKTNFSPLGHFTLSDPKFSNLLEPTVGRKKTAKQTSLAAQKTVRHLLKKHCHIDQAQETDHFSLFETSPSALQLNISLEDSPGTPAVHLNPCSLHKYSGNSSARKKPLSRLKNKQAEPSPAVLKPVKNVILHEKYIDQLSRREGTKKPRKKAAGTETTDPGGRLLDQQVGGLKAAKNALISEATDFISHFKKLQANSLAHDLANSEDDED